MPVLPPSTRRCEEVIRSLNAGSRYFIEQVDRFHDVHVAVDKTDDPLSWHAPFRDFLGLDGKIL